MEIILEKEELEEGIIDGLLIKIIKTDKIVKCRRRIRKLLGEITVY